MHWRTGRKHEGVKTGRHEDAKARSFFIKQSC